MMRLSLLLTMLLLVFSSIAGAADTIEGPKACRQCGMDRNFSPETRMVITHADGTSSGLCSLQCALGEIRKPGNGQIKSVQVADYWTKNLIDAQTAIWVVGGKKSGGMNFPAKWAFARDEDARSFMQDNGGELTTYDRLVQIAAAEPVEGKEASHSSHHQGHDHGGPGGGMIFNPAFSEDIYHVHPKGMWMANYKYMHMVQSGLRNGTTDVPTENATPVGNEPFGYMMVPTRMTMDMHMVMVMYGVTDRFTLMGMGTYLDNRMSMVMNMGDGNEPDDPMSTSGLGDTEIRGIYQICDGLTGSLGVSLPTGDIKQKIETMNMTFRAPYDMQLGSGTVDLKPALTYNALSDDGLWNWGGQASYTYHPGHNRHGYSLGDNAKVNGWLQRALGPAAGWLRFSYNYTQRIDGRDPEIQKLLDPDDGAPTPDADPRNYGGHRIDGFIGTSFAWGPLSLGVEAGLPLYQSLNGLQLKNQWYLTAGIQAMF